MLLDASSTSEIKEAETTTEEILTTSVTVPGPTITTNVPEPANLDKKDPNIPHSAGKAGDNPISPNLKSNTNTSTTTTSTSITTTTSTARTTTTTTVPPATSSITPAPDDDKHVQQDNTIIAKNSDDVVKYSIVATPKVTTFQAPVSGLTKSLSVEGKRV